MGASEETKQYGKRDPPSTITNSAQDCEFVFCFGGTCSTDDDVDRSFSGHITSRIQLSGRGGGFVKRAGGRAPRVNIRLEAVVKWDMGYAAVKARSYAGWQEECNSCGALLPSEYDSKQ